MTENENSMSPPTGEAEEQRSPAKARLLPKVTFGLGAAVLAGVVVVSVPTAPAATGATGSVTTTVGLGAVINAVTGNGIFQTTCCGEQPPIFPFPVESGSAQS
jgi:hypothetical protein